jgi:hypothetical protein
MQEQVAPHRQLIDEGEVLVDGIDPVPPSIVDAGGLVWLALEPHRPLVLAVQAADDLQQRRLARAVVAQQAEHLAPTQMQADVTQCRDRTEALGDVLDTQDVVAGLGERVTLARGERAGRYRCLSGGHEASPPSAAPAPAGAKTRRARSTRRVEWPPVVALSYPALAITTSSQIGGDAPWFTARRLQRNVWRPTRQRIRRGGGSVSVVDAHREDCPGAG